MPHTPRPRVEALLAEPVLRGEPIAEEAIELAAEAAARIEEESQAEQAAWWAEATEEFDPDAFRRSFEGLGRISKEGSA